MSWTHWILATSHVVAVPALVKTLSRQRYLHAVVVSAVILASICMHLSETKHGLVPSHLWRPWSRIALNLDRLCASSSAIYFMWLRWPMQVPRDTELFAVALLGMMCSYLGEQTHDVPTYVVYHLIWHGCAFYLLYSVL